jgi:hypothetical protein
MRTCRCTQRITAQSLRIYAVNYGRRNLVIECAPRAGRLWVNRDLPLPIPGEGRDPVAQPLPHWRRRLSHRFEGPNRLRCLAPQSRFVTTRAVKEGRVKIGKAQKTLGNGAAFRPRYPWPARGRPQRIFVAGRRIASSVRARGYLVAIGLGSSLERRWLTGSAGGVPPGWEQKFGLDVKEAGFDRAGPPKSPQQAC